MTPLWSALGILPGDVVAFTGGGGKTSLALRIAQERADVIFTTTTKLWPTGIPTLFTAELGASWLDSVAKAPRPCCVVSRRDELSPKLIGISPTQVAKLKAACPTDVILVEADGSAGLPLKAPNEHEPVIPACATLVVPVAGARAIGKPLDPMTVHRAARLAELAGAALGDVITPKVVATALIASTRGAPAGARIVPVIGQGDLPEAVPFGEAVMVHLRDRYGRLVVAAPALPDEPVRHVAGDIVAIMLAGGASRRFGANKLLSPWQGHTLIEAALAPLLRAGLREVIVVTGAYHEALAPLLARYPVRVIANRDWTDGMSTSMQSGLAAVGTAAAAIICLADQPYLPAAVLDQLIATYRQTQSPIVAPAINGIRRNPVLFDQSLFPQLAAITGDEGGRSVIAAHKEQVVLIPMADETWFIDIDFPPPNK
jgi:molybdenum cofactor cytidylyltransferase